MALVICPECRREVSDQAEICPHCGFPVHRRAALTPAALDEQVLERLASEGKIAAIKFYREHRPETGLAEAKEAVERLAAERPHEFSAPQRPDFSGYFVGCLYLAIALLLGLVLWIIEPRVHRAWENRYHTSPPASSATPADTPPSPPR